MNKISKFRLLFLFLFSLSIITIFAQERPNVIVILADDLAYGDLGFTGSKDIKTPQLDKLAKNGVVFNNGMLEIKI